MTEAIRHEALTGTSHITPQACSQCGAAFHCGAQDTECWCTQGPTLPPEALRDGVTCLCPKCLGELQERYGLNVTNTEN